MKLNVQITSTVRNIESEVEVEVDIDDSLLVGVKIEDDEDGNYNFNYGNEELQEIILDQYPDLFEQAQGKLSDALSDARQSLPKGIDCHLYEISNDFTDEAEIRFIFVVKEEE